LKQKKKKKNLPPLCLIRSDFTMCLPINNTAGTPVAANVRYGCAFIAFKIEPENFFKKKKSYQIILHYI